MTLALTSSEHGVESCPQIVRAPDVLWRAIPGVAVIALRSPEEDVVVLSGSGPALWDQLAEPQRLDEMAVRFAADCGVPPDVVLDGLGEAVRQLRDRGLVRDHGA